MKVTPGTGLGYWCGHAGHPVNTSLSILNSDAVDSAHKASMASLLTAMQGGNPYFEAQAKARFD